MSNGLRMVLVENENVTITACQIEDYPSYGDDSASRYGWQSTCYMWSIPGLLQHNPVHEAFAQHICATALELVRETVQAQGDTFSILGGEPRWKFHRKAGCNWCPCSPGHLSRTNILINGVRVNLHVESHVQWTWDFDADAELL